MLCISTVRRRLSVRAVFATLIGAGLTAAVDAQTRLPADWQAVRCAKCDTATACDAPEVMFPNETGSISPFEPREALGATDLTHVDLDIELNMAAQNIRTGDCTLHLTSLVNGLTQFTFRLRNNLTITEARINNVVQPLGNIAQVDISTRLFTLDQTYDVGEQFTVRIKYNGAPANLGFGSFTWTTHGPSSTRAVDSLSEPYYAYSWWPAKDGQVLTAGDNSDKFTLDMYVTVPDTMRVPSNGLLISETPLPSDPPTIPVPRKRYHWHSDYPIPTYLVSIAATNYNTWTATYNYPAGIGYPAGSMPVQFFVYPESDTPAGRNAWEDCMDMMVAFREPYGEYPFINEKYGIYQFSFSGGMEHQTMTGQHGSSLSSASEYLTAHELGHQWWGDNVTCRTWSDIWLNEGFATFSEALWFERKSGGSMAAYHAHMASRRPSAFGGTVYRYDTSSAGTIFSSTYAYNKGGWVLHMLRHVMGDTMFFETLRDYRSIWQGGSPTTDDFEAVCSAHYGSSLADYFDQWVYEGNAPQYAFGTTTTMVNGQQLLLVKIVQSQRTTAGNWFVMPIDLVYTLNGTTTITKVLFNNAETEYYVVPYSGAISNIQLDPTPWILHNANTSTPYTSGPPVVLSAYPPPGGQLWGSPVNTGVLATFHAPVTTAAGHYSLVGQATGPVAFSFGYNAGTQTTTLSLAQPLANDIYTLTIDDATIGQSTALPLDGELADIDNPASLPSGDGQAGGDMVLQFEVRRYPTDIDNNLVSNAADIVLLVDVLLGVNTNPVIVARCDINGDSEADADDIQPYLDALEVAP